MEECPYLETCPMFARFRTDASKQFWAELYCQGPKRDDCARKILKDSGEAVPVTLLPSGDHLESPGEE